MHQQTFEEKRPSQLEEEVEEAIEYGPHLRRSQRIRKKNSKYTNVALVKDGNVEEPLTYEEASSSKEWRKAVEEEIDALKQNHT